MKKSELKEIIREVVRESKYEIYHKSFTACANEARRVAEKAKYDIDEDSWSDEVAFGGRYGRARPGIGKTHRFSIALTKNGKETKRTLQFQVYGMENGTFELNAYIG